MDDPAARYQHRDRIGRHAGAVGSGRVIAGADRGFGAIAALSTVHGSIVWRKLQSFVEGAHFARREQWHRNIVLGCE